MWSILTGPSKCKTKTRSMNWLSTHSLTCSTSKIQKELNLFCFSSTTHLFRAQWWLYYSSAKKGQNTNLYNNPRNMINILINTQSGLRFFLLKAYLPRITKKCSTQKKGGGGAPWQRTFGKDCILNPSLKKSRYTLAH